jgi:hypothetical protein
MGSTFTKNIQNLQLQLENINMDLREIGLDGVDWFDMA